MAQRNESEQDGNSANTEADSPTTKPLSAQKHATKRVTREGGRQLQSMPSIEAFLKEPFKVASEWLASQPDEKKRFKLFRQKEVRELFTVLIEYVKRLQEVDPDRDDNITAKNMWKASGVSVRRH